MNASNSLSPLNRGFLLGFDRALLKSAFLMKGAFLLSICYSIILSSDVQQGHQLHNLGYRVIAQYSIASLLMLLLWRVSIIRHAENQANTQAQVVWLLIFGLAARLALLLADSYTSNDMSRYLFDGRIALEGYDPYRLAHDSPELAELKAQWAPPEEHAKYVTLYPPLALALFSFAASFGLGSAVFAWKLTTTFASIATLLLGAKVLQRADKLQHLPLLALSPLLILEAGEGLHLDTITALVILAAIYCWQSKKLLLVGAFIAIGGLIKILPMTMLLPFFIALKTWRQRFLLVFSAIGLWAGAYAASFMMGFRPIGSLAIFFEKWRSGSAVFLWLEPHFSITSLLIMLFCFAVQAYSAIALYLWLGYREQSKADKQDVLMISLQAAMAVPLIISPVIFPWYLLPLMAVLALRPNLPLIVWSLFIPTLYEVLGQFACCQNWAPADWPIHIIGLSLLVALGISLLRLRRYKRSTALML